MEFKLLKTETMKAMGVNPSRVVGLTRPSRPSHSRYYREDGIVVIKTYPYGDDQPPILLPDDIYVMLTAQHNKCLVTKAMVDSLETVYITTGIEELEEVLQEQYGDNAWVDSVEKKFFIFFPE